MNKLKLMVVDGFMNSCEIEIDRKQFEKLGIEENKIKKNIKKRDLNVEITEFLKSFKRK